MPSKSGLFALIIVAGGAGVALLTALLTMSPGIYQLAAPPDHRLLWRMNTADGSVSVCMFRSFYAAPTCGPWGNALAVDPSAAPALQKPLAAPLASPTLLSEPPLEEPPDLASGK